MMRRRFRPILGDQATHSARLARAHDAVLTARCHAKLTGQSSYRGVRVGRTSSHVRGVKSGSTPTLMAGPGGARLVLLLLAWRLHLRSPRGAPIASTSSCGAATTSFMCGPTLLPGGPLSP